MISNIKSDCLSEMLLALRANIEYLKKEGSSQLKVKNGQLINDVGDHYIYEFELDFFQDVPPDSEVEVRINNKSAEGKVIAVTPKSIQVEINKNLGESIAEARLVISSYYLLKLLAEKIESISQERTKLTDLSDKTFGLLASECSLDYQYVIPDKGKSLNDSQEEALRLVMGSEVSFIWGPPGTGKTQTIAKIIEALLSRDLSVLLISHTNIATDGALLATVKHLVDSEDYTEGRMLRVGNIELPALLKKEMVIPEKVIIEKQRPLREEIERLDYEIAKFSPDLEQLDKIIRDFNEYDNKQRKGQSLSEEIKDSIFKIESTEHNLITAQNALEVVETKITKYQTSGSISRFFSGLSLEQLTKEKVSIINEKDKASKSLIIKKQSLVVLEDKIHEIYQSCKQLEQGLKGKDRTEAIQNRESIKKEVTNLTEQRSLLQNQMEELAKDLILKARVIATTLTKSYSSQEVLNREYDCVIIDEASMAPLPAVWCAAGLAKLKTVMVGDFLQLPPVVKHKADHDPDKSKSEIESEEALVEKWLKRDIFKVNEITTKIKSGNPPENLRQLKTQYRMHPEIADVINKLIYKNYGKDSALGSGENTKNNGRELLDADPLPGFHLGIYDTSNEGAISNKTDSGSQYNIYNALICVEIARRAVESGNETVGIISAYRAQINLIQKIIKDVLPEEKRQLVQADTVHRFQGGERKVIIFDVTTYDSPSMYDDNSVEGDDDRLVNVALSRAEDKCIIVGDLKNIEKKHSITSLIKRYIDHCEVGGFPILDSTTLLPKYAVSEKSEGLLSELYNSKKLREETGSSEIFDETDFYPQFKQDLLKAEEEVIIDSPYITEERANNLLPFLHHLANEKGVKVTIITRKSTDHKDQMRLFSENMIEKFEEIGICVLPFAGKVHRKLAIIDRNILWEGSLNILSQRESHEYMRRFEGPETAKQVMAFLKLDKNLGNIGENRLLRCEICTSPGSWYWTDKSKYGSEWTFCLNGMHAPGKLPKTAAEIQEKKDNLKLLKQSIKEYSKDGEPICSNPSHKPTVMRMKNGRNGDFWACPHYPKCKVTASVKKE